METYSQYRGNVKKSNDATLIVFCVCLLAIPAHGFAEDDAPKIHPALAEVSEGASEVTLAYAARLAELHASRLEERQRAIELEESEFERMRRGVIDAELERDVARERSDERWQFGSGEAKRRKINEQGHAIARAAADPDERRELREEMAEIREGQIYDDLEPSHAEVGSVDIWEFGSGVAKSRTLNVQRAAIAQARRELRQFPAAGISAEPMHLVMRNMATGQFGNWFQGRSVVRQVIDDQNVMMTLGEGEDADQTTVWLRGIDTSGLENGESWSPEGFFEVMDYHTYTTAIGGTETVRMVEYREVNEPHAARIASAIVEVLDGDIDRALISE